MKKLALPLIMLMALTLLAGCGKNKNPWGNDGELGEVASIQEPEKTEVSTQKEPDVIDYTPGTIIEPTEPVAPQITYTNIDEIVYFEESLTEKEDVPEDIMDTFARVANYIKEAQPELKVFIYDFSVTEEKTIVNAFPYEDGQTYNDVQIDFELLGDDISMNIQEISTEDSTLPDSDDEIGEVTQTEEQTPNAPQEPSEPEPVE